MHFFDLSHINNNLFPVIIENAQLNDGAKDAPSLTRRSTITHAAALKTIRGTDVGPTGQTGRPRRSGVRPHSIWQIGRRPRSISADVFHAFTGAPDEKRSTMTHQGFCRA
ncbi:MAG: hypothetical protein H7335_17290 [Massilia sp.]|nr:hypothetical protein [Massilia sp.]